MKCSSCGKVLAVKSWRDGKGNILCPGLCGKTSDKNEAEFAEFVARPQKAKRL